MRAAENGWLPDTLTRFGIRRLLDARRSESEARQSESSLADFVQATQAQPIAVTPERANDQHYEVPAEFFEQVLGNRLKYSCCYWPEGVTSLDQAEEAALRETCCNAQLKDGQDVLELGCGWGSLSLWMAKQYPNSRITAVSNSNSQREFIEAKAAATGIKNLQAITADMNNFNPQASNRVSPKLSQRLTETPPPGKFSSGAHPIPANDSAHPHFDRVVSVEMFEHMRNHRRLMNRVHDWLRPDGKLFVHIFCHRLNAYLFRSEGDENWMGRYFFSGGMMPSFDLLPQCGSRLELVNRTTWNGRHYAKTCRAWLNNQDLAKKPLRETLAETYGSDQANIWHNRWRMFFMACEELFAYDQGEEWFVAHYLFNKAQ